MRCASTSHAIAARVSQCDSAALFIAVAIGDTRRVYTEPWRVFNAVGLAHQVAISSLHARVTGLDSALEMRIAHSGRIELKFWR